MKFCNSDSLFCFAFLHGLCFLRTLQRRFTIAINFAHHENEIRLCRNWIFWNFSLFNFYIFCTMKNWDFIEACKYFKMLNGHEFKEILFDREHPLNDYARDYFYSMD